MALNLLMRLALITPIISHAKENALGSFAQVIAGGEKYTAASAARIGLPKRGQIPFGGLFTYFAVRRTVGLPRKKKGEKEVRVRTFPVLP